METFTDRTFETEPEDVTAAAADDVDNEGCVAYYPGMLADAYDQEMELQERLFALQFSGVGEGIEVPGCGC